MSILGRITSARIKYEMNRTHKATAVYLPSDDYSELHDKAFEMMGHRYPLNPETEDERLEYQGMKVFQHRSQSIAFT
jgi:hypothetical protein